ncbi:MULTISPECIES: class I SAM-dependent methyltransferase [Roseobacteraceae]|uniref:Methyltransferase n=1 Tax=Pseudosulfitobacter pseudonitzschiae TaxID=1402135 RepID=A0A221K7Z2_9RHOB|nr:MULTISPECIES: class I SAM-dependent methyltransferase [Roseobacteraceae]ASM75118.1 methyltransferase [Pseudosulfitobacter pseudonitzschiae]
MTQHGLTHHAFSQDTAGYAARAARHVPGLDDVYRMAGLLLAERVPPSGRVLVLGAGGGLELRAFADMQPDWRFDGVDPSAEMIDQACQTLGDMIDRVTFTKGYIDDASLGLFDGATCLLTLHFLPQEERLHTLRQIARRLRPGAPLVVMNHSVPHGQERDLWLRRNAALMASHGMSLGQAEKSVETLKARLPILSPQEDQALLAQAGFMDIQLFYAAFTFRGWVSYLG